MQGINEASVIIVTVLLTLLATVVVILRVIQTKKTGNSNQGGAVQSILLGLHLDDVFALVALFFCYPSSIMLIWGAAMGAAGGHSTPKDIGNWITSVTPEWVVLSKVVWVCLFLQPLILGFAKLSVLLFCRRIFSAQRSFKFASGIMIVLVSAFMICFFFGLFFDCGTNFSANWGSLAEIGQNCPFGFLPTVIYTIIDACLDFIVLILPIPWIFRLQMSTQKKLSVCGCFLLGGLATAAAIVRMVIFIETGVPAAALNRQYVLGLPAYDVVGIVSAEMFWAMVESTLAIIAICLPATRKIINWVSLGGFFGLSALGRYYASLRSNSRSRSRAQNNSNESKDSTPGWQALTISDKDGRRPCNNKNDISLVSVLRPSRNDSTEKGMLTSVYSPEPTDGIRVQRTFICENCGEKQHDPQVQTEYV